MANRATLTQIATLAAAALDADKIGTLTYTAARNEISNCIEKIGKQFTIQSKYTPKLTSLMGEFLPYGKTVEEFYVELPAIRPYDPSGENAMKPAYPVYAPAEYSYTIPKKTIKITVARDRVESSCLNAEAFGMMVASTMQSQEDSTVLYENELRRDLLGKAAQKVIKASTATSASGESKTFATSTAYEAGEFVNNGTIYGVVTEKIPSSNSDNWATLVAAGKIVTIDMIKTISKPVDTSTGEDFIEQIKLDVEEASDAIDGKCLNGHCVESQSLVLYVKFGVKPVLSVRTLAAAFNKEELALDVRVEAVKDFGADAPEGVYAILMDNRGAVLFPNHNTVDEDKNGEGEFTNFYRHVAYTAHVSRNTYFKVYKAS